MIHVVVMKCLIGLSLLIYIKLLWRSQSQSRSRSFKNRGVGVGNFKNRGVGVGAFVYRLHSPAEISVSTTGPIVKILNRGFLNMTQEIQATERGRSLFADYISHNIKISYRQWLLRSLFVMRIFMTNSVERSLYDWDNNSLSATQEIQGLLWKLKFITVL
jgi:hypothetical protein